MSLFVRYLRESFKMSRYSQEEKKYIFVLLSHFIIHSIIHWGINFYAYLCDITTSEHKFWGEQKWLLLLPRPRDSPGKNTGVGCHLWLSKHNSTWFNLVKPTLQLSEPLSWNLLGKNNNTEQDHLYQCLHAELRKKLDFWNFGSWNLNHLRCWCLESPKVSITLWRYKGIFLKSSLK